MDDSRQEKLQRPQKDDITERLHISGRHQVWYCIVRTSSISTGIGRGSSGNRTMPSRAGGATRSTCVVIVVVFFIDAAAAAVAVLSQLPLSMKTKSSKDYDEKGHGDGEKEHAGGKEAIKKDEEEKRIVAANKGNDIVLVNESKRSFTYTETTEGKDEVKRSHGKNRQPEWRLTRWVEWMSSRALVTTMTRTIDVGPLSCQVPHAWPQL